MGRKEQLKWSISNVALQIFCKLGGTPWLVKPSNAKCLIFGIGSAHEKTEEGKVVKYMAYTVCLDTAGNYKTVKPLSTSSDRDSYLNCLEQALIETLNSELNSEYEKCVVHIPFKIRKDELERITNAVRGVRKNSSIDIRAIKVNKEHKYFGFSDHNTKVPYESSLVQLAWNEYLIWTEGLQYGKEKVNKRIAEPIHVEFMYEHGEKQREDDRTYLQDIINLTGANWRGFNSKAQPISILYSSLIAKFMKEFGHLEGVEDMSILRKEANTPWFL
jgi:argonaute-like protein implicated in RNA metabolism and viral defense